MRVLILSAFFAYAAAAPSGLVAPYVYQSLAIPAAIPTISPGDIQAAAIDAQVKFIDKVQEITDQAVSHINEKVITDVNLANERTVEAFWSNEDKRWQALDALKTAEAQIDGAAANNAAAYAKSTLAGVVPYVAAAAPVAPVVPAAIPPPIPPVVYTSYEADAKSVSTDAVATEAEEKETKAEIQEAAVKTAESEKADAVADVTDKTETAAEKSAESPIAFASPIVTPFSGVYSLAVPTARQILAQPVINYAAIQPLHGVLAPTYVKAIL